SLRCSALRTAAYALSRRADSALLYDTLKADGREDQAARQSGRFNAIQHGSQGLASVIGAAIATVDITLFFAICGIASLVATGLILTIKEPPQFDDEGGVRLGYWKNLRVAVR